MDDICHRLCYLCSQIWKGHPYTFFHSVSGGHNSLPFSYSFLEMVFSTIPSSPSPPKLPKQNEAKWGTLTISAALISAWLLAHLAHELSLLCHCYLLSRFLQYLCFVQYVKILALGLQHLTSTVTQIIDAETEISSRIFQNKRMSCIVHSSSAETTGMPLARI